MVALRFVPFDQKGIRQPLHVNVDGLAATSHVYTV